jgi:hypothetical protein
MFCFYYLFIAGKINVKRDLTEILKVMEHLELLGGDNIILDCKDILFEGVVWIHLVLHRGRVTGSFEDIN